MFVPSSLLLQPNRTLHSLLDNIPKSVITFIRLSGYDGVTVQSLPVGKKSSPKTDHSFLAIRP